MAYLLEMRDKVKLLYQTYSMYANVVLKFVFSLVLFLAIRSGIGLDTRVSSVGICIVLALVGAFLPVSVLTFFALALCSIDLLKISYVCTAVFVIVYIILWLFLLRHSSKYGYVFLATPVLLLWGGQYAIPLIFGMAASPIAALCVLGGTVMYSILSICKGISAGETNVNPDEILQLYRYIMNKFIANKEMYMYIIVLVGMMLLINAIRTRKFNFAGEIAVISGAIVNIVLFIMASMVLEVKISIIGLIIWSVLGAIIGYVSAAFVKILDYSSVENVQFEDDDYYYYVKAVPKLKVAAAQNKVKTITRADDLDSFTVETNEDDFEVDEIDMDFVKQNTSRQPVLSRQAVKVAEAENDYSYDDEYED